MKFIPATTCFFTTILTSESLSDSQGVLQGLLLGLDGKLGGLDNTLVVDGCSLRSTRLGGRGAQQRGSLVRHVLKIKAVMAFINGSSLCDWTRRGTAKFRIVYAIPRLRRSKAVQSPTPKRGGKIPARLRFGLQFPSPHA